MFVASSTQWRTGGMGGHATGLDYAAVRQVAAALRAPWSEALLADLAVLEQAALKVWADRRRRDTPGSRSPAKTGGKRR